MRKIPVLWLCRITSGALISRDRTIHLEASFQYHRIENLPQHRIHQPVRILDHSLMQLPALSQLREQRLDAGDDAALGLQGASGVVG